ncbi:MAG TPA: hypothetical protein VK791_07170 [bacterium]|jgi:hypothetical protein|nr:hypothetical protein [bacterium]
MPKKITELTPISDLYRTAFDCCSALWPIFILRIAFLFLNLMFLFLGLTFCCWPFLQLIFGHWDDLQNGNVKSFMSDINWSSYFGDFKILIFVGLFAAFYLTFVCFFLAFFDAAVYCQMNENQKNGTDFSWGLFFEGGVKKMIPMVGLQCTWFLLFLGGVFGVCLLGGLGVLISKVIGWFALLLAVPAGLGLIVLMVIVGTATSLSGAYLVDGNGIWESVQLSIEKAVDHKGRAIVAVLLLGLIYFVFFISFTVVFAVLVKIPLIGILFAVLKFLVTSILAIGFNIYMTSLNVTLQLEPKVSR